jgi:hypothetical protein
MMPRLHTKAPFLHENPAPPSHVRSSLPLLATSQPLPRRDMIRELTPAPPFQSRAPMASGFCPGHESATGQDVICPLLLGCVLGATYCASASESWPRCPDGIATSKQKIRTISIFISHLRPACNAFFPRICRGFVPWLPRQRRWGWVRRNGAHVPRTQAPFYLAAVGGNTRLGPIDTTRLVRYRRCRSRRRRRR